MPSRKTALQRNGCLNPSADEVCDPRFDDFEFFDAEDLVQVKYEMLRRVHTEEGSVVDASRDFGYSRPAFYRIREEFSREGIGGLLPKKRGPKGGHKLTSSVVDFLVQALESQPELGSAELAERLQQAFSVTVHPRSIERALARRKKNSGRIS